MIELLPIGDANLQATIQCTDSDGGSQSCGVYILHGRYMVLFGGVQVVETHNWMEAIATYINECCMRGEVHRVPLYNRKIFDCLKQHLDGCQACM